MLNLSRRTKGEITEPLIETGSENSHYIGDSALISRLPKKELNDASCLHSVELFKSRLASRETYYTGKYGFTPRFKAAHHIRDIVTTDVGELKSEIVFHGDTLNTTARLKSLCSQLDQQILASEALLQRLGSTNFEFSDLGSFELRESRKPLKCLDC